jgi:microcystin degradation protein MlrC
MPPSPAHAPRVAIIGVWLESNRQAPVARAADFTSYYCLVGPEILDAARAPNPKIMGEAAAFVKTMDATGPWQPEPILLAGCHPHGPIDGALLERYLAVMRQGLTQHGPFDAVYVANHGAMLATNDEDPDGTIIALARALGGPQAKVVVTLDLHGNISERMVANCDLIVGYRTNPHVDMTERGEEAALGLRLMLAGLAAPQSAFIRMPITPAPVALLTADGPYGDLIDFGNRRRAEQAGDILNVSIFGGFVFSDSAKNGIGIVVTARRDVTRAQMLAKEIAGRCWAQRERFIKTLTPLADVVATARSANRRPVIVAECADNPGGGGTGRCTELLAALVQAGARNVLYGSFFDPPLAAQAHKLGLGARFTARFNSHAGLPCDVPFSAEAEVVGLHHGTVVGRLGYAQGRTLVLGPSAALRIGGEGGIVVTVISDRFQTADPVMFEMYGLDIAKAATVVVKSRGHFRSGFLPWFPPEHVIEVDTEGLTSPVLERRQWSKLPRPVYPLDENTTWTPPEWA